MPLEADEGGADLVGVAELRRALADGAVFQFQQRAQLGAIEFADAFLHILRQHEIDEGAKLAVMVGEDAVPPPGDPFPPRDGRQGEGDIGQNVEQVAPFGVDELADAGQLRLAIAASAPCR